MVPLRFLSLQSRSTAMSSAALQPKGKRGSRSFAAAIVSSSSFPLIIGCVLFQIHWLQPIQPLILKYAREHGGISEDTTTNTIFPFFAYSLIPCTLLVGAIFQLFGSVPALLVASVADLACVLLVTQATASNYLPFIFAEILFSVSFTSLFTVSACLASGIPGSEYQRASSIIRSAFLLAAITSGIVAQGLESSNKIGYAVWISAGCSGLALLSVIITSGLGWFRTAFKGSCCVLLRTRRRSSSSSLCCCWRPGCCACGHNDGGNQSSLLIDAVSSTSFSAPPKAAAFATGGGGGGSSDEHNFAEPLTPNTVDDEEEWADALHHSQHHHAARSNSSNDAGLTDEQREEEAIAALLDAQDTLEGIDNDNNDDQNSAEAAGLNGTGGYYRAPNGGGDNGDEDEDFNGRRGSSLLLGLKAAPTIQHEGSRVALVLKDVASLPAHDGYDDSQHPAFSSSEPQAVRPSASAPAKSSSTGGSNVDLAIVVAVSKDADGALLGLGLSVIFSVHNLVMTYWQSLLQTVDGSGGGKGGGGGTGDSGGGGGGGGGANGAVFATAYVCAVILTASLAFKRVENWLLGGGGTGPGSISHRAVVVSAIGALVCSCCLLLMSRVSTLIPVAVGFIVYHSVAEVCLTILSAQFGRAVLRVGAHVANEAKHNNKRLQAEQLVADARGAAKSFVGGGGAGGGGGDDGDGGGSVRSAGSSGSAAGRRRHQSKLAQQQPQPAPEMLLSPRAHFGTVYGVVTLLAQALQLVIQFSVGKQGGAGLSEGNVFLVLACVTFSLSLVLVGALLVRRGCFRRSAAAGEGRS